ncbi:mannose-6-phosphate isomerase, class I [Priestia abyssalis]|uniref:mannose-6-phosphate isomerase, class I n=1 Tax=Priestia abyssalis TaxID=1221450 RepID=UPI0009953818|nr:mannose-6-phosphate isomerase, class I [Priestia abyssalis]
MTQPIFLTPVFQERIWGGTRLRDTYHYEIPSDLTGECWAISAHPNGQSVGSNGDYKGKALSELWEHHRELFGHYEGDCFPLLTKILDANDDLSVQVHPDDEYARKFETGELGKTECWYIIDCDEDAEMIFGHHAQSKEEFVSMVENGQWSDLLQRIKIKPGDFFYVPSGSIHALCKGTLVLETQQSSDTTYRVYDYDRRDQDGHLRELHLEKAIEVTTVPHTVSKVEPAVMKTGEATITTFIEEQYFTVYKWDVHSRLEMGQDKPFMLVSVIDGDGMLTVNSEKYSIEKGQHFILPYNMGDFVLEGHLQLIVSHP